MQVPRERCHARHTTWRSAPLTAWLLAGLLSLLVAGCADPELEYLEVKRLNEAVTPSELNSFLKVVRSLPGRRLPALPMLFLPPANWNTTRTLPVRELVQEEVDAFEERWNIDWLAAHCPRGRHLEAALRRERMTFEQFLGITLALGMALSVDSVPDDQDLRIPLERGRQIVDELLKDQRVFSALSDDSSHYVLLQATWVTLTERLKRLQQVPDENRAIVRQHRQFLEAAYPEEFRVNPLANFSRILENTGLPFEESAAAGLDDEITWNRDDAIQGTAPLAPRTIPLR